MQKPRSKFLKCRLLFFFCFCFMKSRDDASILEVSKSNFDCCNLLYLLFLFRLFCLFCLFFIEFMMNMF